MLARLIQKVLDGLLLGGSHGLVLEEKAAAIEIKRIGRAGHVIFGMRPLLDFAIMLIHPVVEPVQRENGRDKLESYTVMLQPAEAGGDADRHVSVSGPARERGLLATGPLESRTA